MGPNGVIWIPHKGDTRSRWNQLFEQFEILDLEHIRQNGDASYISTRPCKAFDLAPKRRMETRDVSWCYMPCNSR
jgi:hypothetical protein